MLSVMSTLVLGPLYYVVLIAALLYVCRGRLEGWLASVITAALTYKLRAPLTLEKLEIRWKGRFSVTGLRVTGLELGNDPRGTFKAPFFARVGTLEVQTEGLLGLLSLPGLERIGPYERELKIGFASRAIETAELADVEIYVEIEGTDNETGKTLSNIGYIEELVTKSKTKKARKAAARRKFLEQWRAKWDHPDPSHHHGDDDDPEEGERNAGVSNIEAGSQAFAASAAAETPRGLGARLKKIASTLQSNRTLGLAERTEVWKQVFGRFRDTDAADHEAAKDATKNDKLMAKLDKARKAEKMHEMWRIGRLHVHDAVIAVGDDELRLGEAGWTLNAFIDDTEKLVRTVAKGILRSAAIDNNLVKVAAKSAAGAIKKKVAATMGRASSSAALPGGRSGMPEHWMDAEGVDTCSRCNTTKFTLTVRKHHCRFCGQVVCDKCSKRKQFYEAIGASERCCDVCFEVQANAEQAKSDAVAVGVQEVRTKEVFENQRHKLGWKKTSLPDRQPFTDEEGDGYGVGNLAAIQPDPGFRWLASDWRVTMTGNLDKDGWQYGGVLWAKGFIGWSGNYSRLKHFTRRRKLIREMARL